MRFPPFLAQEITRNASVPACLSQSQASPVVMSAVRIILLKLSAWIKKGERSSVFAAANRFHLINILEDFVKSGPSVGLNPVGRMPPHPTPRREPA